MEKFLLVKNLWQNPIPEKNNVAKWTNQGNTERIKNFDICFSVIILAAMTIVFEKIIYDQPNE